MSKKKPSVNTSDSPGSAYELEEQSDGSTPIQIEAKVDPNPEALSGTIEEYLPLPDATEPASDIVLVDTQAVAPDQSELIEEIDPEAPQIEETMENGSSAEKGGTQREEAFEGDESAEAASNALEQSESEDYTSSEHLSISDQTKSVENSPKKRNWFIRLFSWFGGLFRKKKRITPNAQPTEGPQEIFDEKWAKESQEEITRLRNSIERLKHEAEEIQQRSHALQEEQGRVENWLEGLKRSYYWKVSSRMDGNLAVVKRDIEEYEGLVRALELPAKDTLLNLRMAFHRGLFVNCSIFAIPTFLLYFIPWFSKQNFFSWMIDLFRSPLFWVLLATIAAVVMGMMLLLRRVLGSKKISPLRTIKSSIFSVLIPLAVYGLWRFQDFVRAFVTPVIEQIRPTALWVILILFVFTTIALLIIYYQGWSVFRRTVTDEVARLNNVATGYVKTRQELHRLEFLYSQVNDWLRIIAHSLYRPWKVHPDWKSPNQAQVASESFPMALRVAQAVENDASEAAELNRTIASRLLVQGWRAEAFEKSLSEIGRHLGYESQKVNPELLEADLPHQPNNSRKLVLSYFEHSADTASLGSLDLGEVEKTQSLKSKPDPTDRYLVEVARDQLNYLIDQSQSLALSEARPSVQQVVKNPLSELAESDTFEEVVETSEWNDFLADGLGLEDPVQTPMGNLAFTVEGRKNKASEKVTSKILMPERVAKTVGRPKAEAIDLIAVEGNPEKLPAEVMLRFDFVDPVPPSHVELVQNTQKSLKQNASEENGDDL